MGGWGWLGFTCWLLYLCLLFGLMWQNEMANYRRAREGHTYFFTVVTYRRQSILGLDESRSILREVIIEVRERYPFTVEAWVLLPEHLHCIWQLPGDGIGKQPVSRLCNQRP